MKKVWIGTAMFRKSRLVSDGEKRLGIKMFDPNLPGNHWGWEMGRQLVLLLQNNLTCQEREEAEVVHAAGKLR